MWKNFVYKNKFALKEYIWYNFRMDKIFENYGIKIEEKAAERFSKYCNMLVEYNGRYNLTAITEEREIYVKHFVDSLLGSKLLKSGKVIDVGTGGGFPGLPLKIVNEELETYLLEATGKKCEFLNDVVKELGLKNVTVINGRAEDLAKDIKFREKFDYCVSRAVARLNVLCEYCMPLVKKGGIFLSYKGEAEEEISEAASAIEILGGKITEEKKFSLEGAKRELIVIEKIKSTDLKYPRANGRIRKNPL